jgi:hypothetical protein
MNRPAQNKIFGKKVMGKEKKLKKGKVAPVGGKTKFACVDGPDFDGHLVNFDELMPELTKNKMGHDWWTIDLCFWPDAWAVTDKSKKYVDTLNKKSAET